MRKIKLAMFLLGSLAMAVRGEEARAPASADRARAEQAFASVNGRMEQLASLQYKVVRKTQAKGVSLTEQWSVCVTSQGWMRVDYTMPEKRIFMVDSTNLLEYLPEARKALRTPLTGEGRARLAAVMKRLAVDGMRLGQTEELLKHFKAATQRSPGELVVEGADPAYEVRIDPVRRVLLAFDQWNRDGEKNLSIQASDFLEASPGIWLPTRVRTVAVGKEGGPLDQEVRLSGIRVNAAIPQETFDFSLPDDVKIVEAGLTPNK